MLQERRGYKEQERTGGARKEVIRGPRRKRTGIARKERIVGAGKEMTGVARKEKM